MNIRLWRLWPVVLLLVAFVPLTRGADAPEPFRGELKWKPIFNGVDHVELAAKEPRAMRGHAVRIDLTADGIEFLATPPIADKPTKTAGLKTSTFLTTHKCQVAINASAFGPVRAEEGKEQDVAGLHVSGGAVVSKGNEKYDALLLSKKNKAWLSAPPFELKDVHTAVGGFQIVLKNGKVPDKLPDYNKGLLHPRTAAGVSADGKFLYLLVIDGRQEEWSQGASIQEVGEWLKGLGAADGINLDGGGTTTMVVADSDGKAKVLNRPIHSNKPGTERVSGSHLGVFAKPLKKEK